MKSSEKIPLILAVDTSCDETAAAVTRGREVLSNIIWSQASAHAKFGGVMPSLAARMHEDRIDWVVDKALKNSGTTFKDIDAFAVTMGPGLAIALGVGIKKAKELALKFNKPLVPINHIEGHLLSPMSQPNSKSKIQKLKGSKINEIVFPALGLVISGGHTELVEITKPGNYKILAYTEDDALGEALDKAARMLGLGYPGGAVLEKMAKEGVYQPQVLPLPMARREEKLTFSYSGIKTAMWRLIENTEKESGKLTRQQISDLSCSFQQRAFQHLYRICHKTILKSETKYKDFLVGGGVAANIEVRRIIRKLAGEFKMTAHFPYSKRLVGDNAAMIGVAATIAHCDEITNSLLNIDDIDRKPRWEVDEKPWGQT